MILFCSLLLAYPFAVALYNFFTAPRLHLPPPNSSPLRHPSVSLLVPVRNEAANLERHLAGWLALDYPDLEILVLDDNSQDRTGEILRAAQARHDPGARFRVLVGEPLPETWLGKSWAAAQLARAARGEILIFCDADVAVHPRAVEFSVAWMLAENLACLSGLAEQKTTTFFERAIVPFILVVPIATLVPLRYLLRSRSTRLMAAVGQWLVFTREAYEACGGHGAVRQSVVEDMDLVRKIKGLPDGRYAAIFASHLLSTRMYAGGRDVRQGFRKNFYPLIGGTPLSLALFLVLQTTTMVLPWWFARENPTPLLLGLTAVFLAGHCYGSGLRTVVFQPLAAIALPLVMLDSFLGYLKGNVRWKDRPLRIRDTR